MGPFKDDEEGEKGLRREILAASDFKMGAMNKGKVSGEIEKSQRGQGGSDLDVIRFRPPLPPTRLLRALCTAQL